jgi:hypothetical protein
MGDTAIRVDGILYGEKEIKNMLRDLSTFQTSFNDVKTKLYKEEKRNRDTEGRARRFDALSDAFMDMLEERFDERYEMRRDR